MTRSAFRACSKYQQGWLMTCVTWLGIIALLTSSGMGFSPTMTRRVIIRSEWTRQRISMRESAPDVQELELDDLSEREQLERTETSRMWAKYIIEKTAKKGRSSSEIGQLIQGVRDVMSGQAFDTSKMSRLLTLEDIVANTAMIPMAAESIRTAFTGQLSTTGCVACVIASLLSSVAHAKMSADTPRDYRAPRLAEFHSIYEFSAWYLPPFAWLLWRITPAFPSALKVIDLPICSILTVVTIYGVAFAAYGKGLLKEANKEGYEGVLEASNEDYQAQAQLYLTGNVVINVLACLFIPFAWTITFRGTEWWERVQALHPNQAAFLGVSVLVAILGDVLGNQLARLKELELVRTPEALVVMGIVSNFLFLLFPELVFNIIYGGGVSELSFYWD